MNLAAELPPRVMATEKSTYLLTAINTTQKQGRLLLTAAELSPWEIVPAKPERKDTDTYQDS